MRNNISLNDPKENFLNDVCINYSTASNRQTSPVLPTESHNAKPILRDRGEYKSLTFIVAHRAYTKKVGPRGIIVHVTKANPYAHIHT